MATEWTEASSDVIHTAQRLIAKYHPNLLEANIAFVFRDKAQKSGNAFVFGQASKVSDKQKPFMNYDFMIWLSEEDYSRADSSVREALIDHELSHCGGHPGEWKMLHHDFEEFTAIIERHGLWTRALRSITHAETVYQMSLGDKLTDAVQKIVGRVEALKPDQIQQAENKETESSQPEEPKVDHDKAASDLLDDFLNSKKDDSD